MKLRPATRDDILSVQEGLELLRAARNALKRAGAIKALKKTKKAMKSAEGALRHVCRRYRAAK